MEHEQKVFFCRTLTSCLLQSHTVRYVATDLIAPMGLLLVLKILLLWYKIRGSSQGFLLCFGKVFFFFFSS